MDEQISTAVDEIMAARYRPKVGDRVRVLNAECDLEEDWLHGHGGCLGEVFMLFPETFGDLTTDGHDVMVSFDQDAEGRITSSWFAPTELEPVDG